MATQTIGTVNVQVNRQQPAKVTSINYGVRTIKGSADISMSGAGDGDVIIYNANTQTFAVKSIADATTSLDAGYF